MAWIVQCQITGDCFPASQSRKFPRNDPKYAKRYLTLSGAKSARGSLQQRYDYWYGNSNGLVPQHYTQEEYEKRYHRDYQVIEI